MPPSPSPLQQGEERVKPSGNLHQTQVICSANTDVLTWREVTDIPRAAMLQRLLCTPAETDRE